MHIRAKHNGVKDSEAQNFEKPLKCKTCNKTYSCPGSLYNHKKFECGKEPSFFCQFCDYSCKRKGRLKVHMQSRHGGNNANPRFNCIKCGRSYKYKAGLTAHMKYKCNQ